ncbi:MAG: hypothetical protein KGL02_04830 [Acidobacteriota bacterium]|nr:hypothetical protein [Acidobacteriota bacterium]MDE3171099.1 hypothetical protein [Acidobacteriota bacterium]
MKTLGTCLEITGVILASFGIAVALEWWGLNGLMRLLPGRGGVSHERK